tara:strand:- start:21 stop:467 length:447 start_codon:yes stop_codon:yes gene_type:complete
MNKRGFIKTLEAVIAVMVVFIFIFTVGQKNTTQDSNVAAMKGIQEGLLSGISQDDGYRSCIVNAAKPSLPYIGSGDGSDPCGGLKDYITNTLPSRFVKDGKERYRIFVCDVDDCTLPNLEGKFIYTSAVIISSDLKDYNPRILRIWMW